MTSAAVVLPLANDGEIADPPLSAIASFVAFALNLDLSVRIASMGLGGCAVDPANVFEWDLAEQQGHKTRLPVPSLFVSWDGRSAWADHTTYRRTRTSEAKILYVWSEPPRRESLDDRRGLFSMVDRSIGTIIAAGRHAGYAYKATPAGSMLRDVVPGLADMQYLGGRGLPRVAVDESREANGIMGRQSGRDYPAFEARIAVTEEIWRKPTSDATAAFYEGAEVDITKGDLPIMTRILQGPEGSDEP